jgi:toxin-antitoxin system PIN domain toxin
MPRYTRSSLFPDVNVWIALTYDRHAHHLAARNWLQALDRDARLFFCRFTQIGFLRLLTNEAVMGHDEVRGQAEAWGVYDRWIEDPRVLFVDEPRGMEPSFRSMSQLQRPAPKDWADSYLAAFAMVSEMTLVTFDQGFRTRIRDLIVLSK